MSNICSQLTLHDLFLQYFAEIGLPAEMTKISNKANIQAESSGRANSMRLALIKV